MKIASLLLPLLVSLSLGVAPALAQTRSDAIRLQTQDAIRLQNQAVHLQDQGRYAEAVPLLERALPIIEKARGPNHPDVATSLGNLGTGYQELHRFADAGPLLKRSLAILEKARGSSHPEVAMALIRLALLYLDQRRHSDAGPLFKQALAIREKALGPNHIDVAEALLGLALLYQGQSLYADAEPFYKRALAIEEKALGPNHPDVAATLSGLAELYRTQGRYADAELMNKRALAIREKALGPNHPDVATTLNNLALVHNSEGHYADAETLYMRSLAIREKALGPNHPDVASSLNNLAAFYHQQGRYADAEALFKRSLTISEKALGPNHPDVANSLNNLAALYEDQGRFADAEPLFYRSLEIWGKVLGPDHRDVAQSLNNLADFYQSQGRFGEAIPFVRRTIDQQTATPSITFSILTGSETRQLISAQQSFADSYQVLQFSSSSTAADAVQKLAQRYAAGTGPLSVLVRQDQDLMAEAGTLDKALIAAVSKAPSERNQVSEDALRKRSDQVGAARKALAATLTQQFPDYVALSRPIPLSLPETQLLLADDEAVVAFGLGEKASYAWVVSKTDAYWTEIPVTSKVMDDEVQQLRQSLTFRVDKPFDAALAYKIYVQTFGPIADKIAGKKRLSIIANGALTSIPFEVLVTANPQGKELMEVDWLSKSYAVTILPSIFSLKTMRAQAGTSKAPKAMIAFADPVFSKTAQAKARTSQVAMRSVTNFYQGTQIDISKLAEALPQLPSTRVEVQTIGKTLGVAQADLKLGLSATEGAVKQAKLDQYRIVYFATHGLVSGDLDKFSKAKAEPALALTMPAKPNDLDNGLLQASEVAQLKLNADWVVLSACNTASSDGVGAEALSGLARAFLYAGARSLVVSHWDVADETTAAMMSQLFALSSKNPNLSHGEALQQAMLSMLAAAATEEQAHPRYWAPFVVVGEPANQTRN